MTNFSGRVSGFFHTIYEDKLVAVISGIMMEDLIESAMKENKLNYKPNLQKITVDSNPCIVMYKCKEKTIFNEK